MARSPDRLIQPLRAALIREAELRDQVAPLLTEQKAVVCRQAELLRTLQDEGYPTTVVAVPVRREAGLAGVADFRDVFSERMRQRMSRWPTARCAELHPTAEQPGPPPAPPTPPAPQVVKRVTTTETRVYRQQKEPTPVGPPQRRNGWLRTPGSK